MNVDVAVIGGGPAGLGAALEAKKMTSSVLVLERDRELGGILNQCIHNGFGLHEFKEELTGPEYAGRFIQQAKEANIDFMLNTMVLHVDEKKHIVAVNEEGVHHIRAKAVVFAMGCRERTAGAIAMNGYRPAGVMTAGMAQRMMNMEGLQVGKEVVIYGSGDIGLIMARRMTLEGAKVKAVVEIMPFSSGLNRNIAQCLEDYEIPLLLHHKIVRVHGKNRVEAVDICALDEQGKEIPKTKETVSCDTLLLSIGLIPENELSEQAGVVLDKITKGAVVSEDMQTEISGIFACGNVLHVHDIVDFVTAESRIAGASAARYALGNREKEEFYATHAGEGVRYVLPQKIHKEGKHTLKLSFRTDGIYHREKVIVKCGDEILTRKAMNVMVPSEMVIISLDKEQIGKINGDVSVYLEGKA